MVDGITIERLRPHSTCEVSDALLKLGHPCGGFVSNISMWSPQRQNGPTKTIEPVYTVRFVRKSDTIAPTLAEHHIDAVPSGAVIFISMPEGVENGAFGELVALRARYQGAVGTVVNGNLRDLGEQRKLGYPVFALGVATPAYHEIARPSEINVPIALRDGRTVVNPSDCVMADVNGNVCIPERLIEQVVELVPELAAADARIQSDIAQGVKFLDSSKTHRAWAPVDGVLRQ